MPCEACNVQFTVFRRKRCCFDCKRFYCSSCLNTPSLRSAVGPLCERCSIFAKRPLLKVDLLQLKPKDLIFYLQSKHISTAGCVEKDELVGLVLNHIQQTDQSQPESAGQDARSFDTAHSFDSLKQSCQNFFSNISEKVDAFSFEAKPTQNKPQAQQNRRSSSTNQQSAHISEQPRVSTREIPTYASCKNRPADDDVTQINVATPSASNSMQSNHVDYSLDSSTPRTTSQTSSLESKSSSSFASSSQQPATIEIPLIEQHCLRTTPERPKVHSGYDVTINGFASGCDCSDDELITTFRARTCERLQSPQSTSSLENPMAGPSGSSNILTSTTSTTTKKSSPSLKIESYDESSESSFEELGAIGGISDESKIGVDNNGQTSEPWQFVEKDALDTGDIAKDKKKTEVANNGGTSLTVAVMQQDANVQLQRPVVLPTRPKKVTRRRSESYLNRTKNRSVNESPTSPEVYRSLAPQNFVNARCLREEDELANERTDADVDETREEIEVAGTHFQCKRCGKHRINIKNHVEKMRRHLENSQMTESDIKRELEEFLVYLEKRTKSFDCSDSETTAASSVSGIHDANCQNPPATESMSPLQFYDDNEGIHVYAPSSRYGAEMTDSRFINLEDFESLEELERLCVKQLKEVLMLNRVDYKGCCEKQELLDRVVRLWKNLKSTPTIDKLQTDELCKICMDAPIECVILECGHMATCTSCGKVLSECPICRQYIVRVVRFFKA